MTGFDTFDLRGRAVLVCGGGTSALGPIGELLEAGARVTVIGRDLSPTVADLAARGLLQVERRGVRPDDLRGAALVVPTSGNEDTDDRVRELAGQLGVLGTRSRSQQPGADDRAARAR